MTIEELKERLLLVDEITLLEVLEIDAEDLVNKFEDLIIDNYDKLVRMLDD
jgi:hypothetical protein